MNMSNMSPYQVLRSIAASAVSFENALRCEALASVVHETMTFLPVEAIRGFAEMLANNAVTKDAASKARAALVVSFCEKHGIATMDVSDMTHTGSLLYIQAARAVVSSILTIHEESMRATLARIADGLLADASYLTMGPALTDQTLVSCADETTEDPAPISGVTAVAS